MTNPEAAFNPDGITLSQQFVPTMHRDVYPAISPSHPDLDASGKNVLITGGTRGIGKATAITWAKAGAASIVITGRDTKLLAEVSDEIKHVSPNTKVVALPAEAASEDDVKNLWSKVKAEIGIIDVLIANAGAFSEANVFPVTGKIKPSLWWSDMSTNIFGTYLQVYQFLQQYLATDAEPKGTIIILSSGAAGLTLPGASAYTISKLVGLRLVENLHVEHPNVRVFAIHPGLVNTNMALDIFAGSDIDPPELTGGLSLYLSTSKADFLRGSYISVNWDVDELEKHADEIREKKLLNLGFLNAQLGPEGHPFEK